MRPQPSLKILDGQRNGPSGSSISFTAFIRECQDSLGDLLSMVEMSDVDKKWVQNIIKVYSEVLASAPPKIQNLRLKKARFYQKTKAKLLAWIKDELKKSYFLRGGDEIIRAIALEHLQSLESIPTLRLITIVDDTRVGVAHALDLP